jgi:hypothetical protein
VQQARLFKNKYERKKTFHHSVFVNKKASAVRGWLCFAASYLLPEEIRPDGLFVWRLDGHEDESAQQTVAENDHEEEKMREPLLRPVAHLKNECIKDAN